MLAIRRASSWRAAAVLDLTSPKATRARRQDSSICHLLKAMARRLYFSRFVSVHALFICVVSVFSMFLSAAWAFL